MEKYQHHRKELHLLPISTPPPKPATFDHVHHVSSSLDLQLSISLTPFKPPPPKEAPLRRRRSVDTLRWQASEQIRLAAMERAYTERVRELTRREMEMAQSELARARILWDRTMEDVARVEEMKENAIIYNRPPIFSHQVSLAPNNGCIEIACRSCRRRFHPSY